MLSHSRIRAAALALLVCACQVCARSAPLREEQVQFSNGGIRLAGTVVLPAGIGRHPAVVMFHGSGPQARDAFMARWFAKQGLVALTYDKRGVGDSSGDYRQVPFTDLCGDGLAGIDLLKARKEVDPQRIGVWGVSQGGWLGPLAASRSREVAFVIAVSGPGVSPGEQMIFYYASELRAQGFSDSEIADASSLRSKVWHYLATGAGYAEAKAALVRDRSRRWYAAVQAQNDGLFAMSDSAILDDPSVRSRLWFRVEMNYDPTAALRRLSAPALFLFGEKDELVPVGKSVEIIRRTLTETHTCEFTIKVFPGADHGIYVASADGTRRFAPGYLDSIREWLLRKVTSTNSRLQRTA